MFEDLSDSFTKLFSWRWPTVEGVITAIGTEPAPRGELQLAISYEFSVGDDGPYTGEYYCGTRFVPTVTASDGDSLIGKSVTVRYQPNNPSVNTLDPRQWRNL